MSLFNMKKRLQQIYKLLWRFVLKNSKKISNLMKIQKSFYQPLLATAETEVLPSVPKQWIKQIFINAEQIYQMNQQVLDMLQARISNWENVQRVGDIFIKMVNFKFLQSKKIQKLCHFNN